MMFKNFIGINFERSDLMNDTNKNNTDKNSISEQIEELERRLNRYLKGMIVIRVFFLVVLSLALMLFITGGVFPGMICLVIAGCLYYLDHRVTDQWYATIDEKYALKKKRREKQDKNIQKKKQKRQQHQTVKQTQTEQKDTAEDTDKELEDDELDEEEKSFTRTYIIITAIFAVIVGIIGFLIARNSIK